MVEVVGSWVGVRWLDGWMDGYGWRGKEKGWG